MAIAKSETALQRLLARLKQLEDDKGRTARELAHLKQEVDALRARPAASAGTSAPQGTPSAAERASRRGMLKIALSAAAATVGAGTLLEARGAPPWPLRPMGRWARPPLPAPQPRPRSRSRIPARGWDSRPPTRSSWARRPSRP